MTPGPAAVAGAELHASARPPGWMIAVTAILAVAVLAMAVAETNLWLHYLIDAGEPVSLAGLAFVAAAGVYLYSRGQLRASLPLMAPWLLFPVITQGDQLIDNLSINWMRAIVHLLLGLIFGIPVAVVVAGVRAIATSDRLRERVQGARWLAILPGVRMMADGRLREGGAVLAVMLLAILTWIAVEFLGALMVATLVVMIWAVLVAGFAVAAGPPRAVPLDGLRRERAAAALLAAGVIVSLGLYLGFKNRPGAYQGSPSYYMDPSQPDAGFRLDAVAVPAGPVAAPLNASAAKGVLTGYARAFDRLVSGYYVLDRNYNYDFHNRLFLRSTPLLPDYRRVGLIRVHEAEAIRLSADAAATGLRPAMPDGDPLAALIDDVRAYAAFTFGRAPVLERMSGEFEQTEAGLQHATHLYEGEGKVVGVRLAELLTKHGRVLAAAEAAEVTTDFLAISRSVHDLYANRIVGF
jgi:hypothetical protein